jgi:hypothetical protein
LCEPFDLLYPFPVDNKRTIKVTIVMIAWAALGLQKVLEYMIQNNLTQDYKKGHTTAHHCFCALLKVTLDLKELLETSETEDDDSSEAGSEDEEEDDTEDDDDADEVVSVSNLCFQLEILN